MVNDMELLVDRFVAGDATPQEAAAVLAAMRADASLRRKVDTLLTLEGTEMPDMPALRAAAADADFALCAIDCEGRVRRALDGPDAPPRDMDDDSFVWRHDGTPIHAIGVTLEHDGHSVVRQYGLSLDDIRRYLQTGYVIAVVTLPSSALHAVQVLRADDGTVRIYDPEDEREKDLPEEDFLDAWNGSLRYAVAAGKKGTLPYAPHPAPIGDTPVDDAVAGAAAALAGEAYEKEAETLGRKTPYCDLPDDERRAREAALLHALRAVVRMGYDIRKARTCPRCGGRVDPTDRRCPHCLHELPER